MTTYNQDGTPMGGGGSNQLMDLFTVVSNPDAYTAKIQALQDAINEHKKVIEAVGPAKNILELREQTKEANALAVSKITDAQAKADVLLAEAKTQAESVVANAKAEATALVDETKAVKEEAKADAAAVKKTLKDAGQAKTDAEAVIADYTARSKALENQQAEAESLKAEAQATKTAILAKHQAFIASL